jgi:hypothetical protein
LKEILKIVGNFPVSESVLNHKHIAATKAVLNTKHRFTDPVVGTQNKKGVELYGWHPNVAPHVDRTGFMYFMPLFESTGTINAFLERSGDPVELPLVAGNIYRMFDYASHWTTGETDRQIALFIGAFDSPMDNFAINRLKNGLRLLELNSVYAPKTSFSTKMALDDEVFVETSVLGKTRLINKIYAAKHKIITCAYCEKPAMILDSYYPYEIAKNKCKEHFRQ